MFNSKEWHSRPENVAKRKKYQKDNPEKVREYSRKYSLKHPERVLHRTAKARASKKGLEFNIDYSDIVLPEVCPILGIPIILSDGFGTRGGKMNSPSLDRIDNDKGYVKGNVQVISHMANSMKFTANKEQLLAFANWILKEYG